MLEEQVEGVRAGASPSTRPARGEKECSSKYIYFHRRPKKGEHIYILIKGMQISSEKLLTLGVGACEWVFSRRAACHHCQHYPAPA